MRLSGSTWSPEGHQHKQKACAEINGKEGARASDGIKGGIPSKLQRPKEPPVPLVQTSDCGSQDKMNPRKKERNLPRFTVTLSGLHFRALISA